MHKTFFAWLLEKREKVKTYMMHHNGSVGDHTLTANLVFSVVSYDKAEEQPASCGAATQLSSFILYRYTMHSHLCPANMDFSLLLCSACASWANKRTKAKHDSSAVALDNISQCMCIFLLYIHFMILHTSVVVLRNEMPSFYSAIIWQLWLLILLWPFEIVCIIKM